MSLTTRTAKGSKLTIAEMDGNLTYLEGIALTPYLNYFDFSSDSETNITTQDVYVKLNTDTTMGFSRNGLTHANNRVTNTGATRIFYVSAIGSFQSASGSEIGMAVFKNGSIVSCSEQFSIIPPAGATKSAAIPSQCLVQLEENDYLEIFVKNSTSTANITTDTINVILQGL
jgi:hypothetical protein